MDVVRCARVPHRHYRRQHFRQCNLLRHRRHGRMLCIYRHSPRLLDCWYPRCVHHTLEPGQLCSRLPQFPRRLWLLVGSDLRHLPGRLLSSWTTNPRRTTAVQASARYLQLRKVGDPPESVHCFCNSLFSKLARIHQCYQSEHQLGCSHLQLQLVLWLRGSLCGVRFAVQTRLAIAERVAARPVYADEAYFWHDYERDVMISIENNAVKDKSREWCIGNGTLVREHGDRRRVGEER